MKKRIFVTLLIFLLLVSCNRDKAQLIITDFSKPTTITLKPYKWKPYAMLKIDVEGITNDTIRINYNLYGDSNYFLSGRLDTLLIQTDYYGGGPVKLVFDPYKATKGKLKIDFSL